MNFPHRNLLATRRVPGLTTVSSTLASVPLRASPRSLPSLLPKKARQANHLLLVRSPPPPHPLHLPPRLLLRLRLRH